MNHQAGIEVYVAGATNKYVTVTGNRCEDYEYGDRTQELQVLLDKFMRRPEVGAENAINAKNSDLSMEQLLQLAKAVRMGQHSQPFGMVHWRDVCPHQRQIWLCAVISPFGQDGMLPRWTLCSGSRD